MALEVQNKLNLFFDRGLTGYDNQKYKKKLCYHSKKPKKNPPLFVQPENEIAHL